jgi:MYXO-CTERM domain-containing protein
MNIAGSAISAFAGLLLSFDAAAALVSYDLTRSSELRDGPAYLRVTIDDQGLPGRINFNVTVLAPLLELADRRFGIEKFAFNSDIGLSASNISGLPKDWRFDTRERMGGYGLFDVQLEAKNDHARMDSLSFSIKNVSWDTIWSYVDPSSNHGKGAGFFFAAQVGGLDTSRDFCVTDAAYFAGSTPTPQAVPLPPAAGLMLGGLGMLGAWSRRRRTSTAPAS